MATKWGCVGVGSIAHDFFTAIKSNLPHDEHEVKALRFQFVFCSYCLATDNHIAST